MAMKLASQKSLERTPDRARPQERPVMGDQLYVGLVAARGDPVATADGEDETLDSKPLSDDLELQEMWRLRGSDPLHQIAALINAPNRGSNSRLVAHSP
jgi:hypothetical protein